MAGSERSFLLLYGSQTGQAEAIAGLIQERAIELGYFPRLCCLSQTEKEVSLARSASRILSLCVPTPRSAYFSQYWLERESLVVVVVSTTGEGDPPDTVNKFWRRLKKNTLPANHLKSLRYALLGESCNLSGGSVFRSLNFPMFSILLRTLLPLSCKSIVQV